MVRELLLPITSRKYPDSIPIQEGGRYHALGHLNCRNLCGRNLCHSPGVVAGVMNSHVQHWSRLLNETALGGREGFADYLPYTPIELLTVPYRDRLSCMPRQERSVSNPRLPIVTPSASD